MALSNFLKNIEDSPRSTKVAVGIAVAASAMVVLAACGGEGQSAPDPTPTARVVYVYATPEHTPSPIPTNTPAPTATPEPQPEEPTPLPTATPTPDVDDYFVILHQSKILDDNIGAIDFYAIYPSGEKDGSRMVFHEESFYLQYLKEENVITSEQRDAYLNGEPIKIPLLPISTATYKLFETDPFNASKLKLKAPKYLFHYADKSSSDSNESVLGGKISLDGGEGYVTIRDGNISVSAVDDAGNTTTVNVEGVGAKELLDYWLSQNKITIEQKNQYGETGEIQFSLKDGVDLFDFASSSNSGASIGIGKEEVDIIREKVLPFFTGAD